MLLKCLAEKVIVYAYKWIMIKDDCESSLFWKLHSELALASTVTSRIQKFPLHVREAVISIWSICRMLTKALLLRVANTCIQQCD